VKTRDPLYLRVYEEIVARIASGSSGRGGRLPPERVFSEELGVSRATVRRALAALEADGLIESVQGRGTFLTRLVEPANTLVSFTQLARSLGARPTSEVLLAHVRAATIDEGERFRIAPGSEVFELRRLRKMDSLPVAIGSDVVPLALAPSLPDHDWAAASLYEVLTASGSRPVRSDSSIEARATSAHEAPHLGVPDGAPVLDTETATYAVDGRLVDFGRIVYRGDRYRFRATLVIQTQPLPGAA
jgi:GntR family transcriptional regulator